jgi:hypothetical protein
MTTFCIAFNEPFVSFHAKRPPESNVLAVSWDSIYKVWIYAAGINDKKYLYCQLRCKLPFLNWLLTIKAEKRTHVSSFYLQIVLRNELANTCGKPYVKDNLYHSSEYVQIPKGIPSAKTLRKLSKGTESANIANENITKHIAKHILKRPLCKYYLNFFPLTVLKHSFDGNSRRKCANFVLNEYSQYLVFGQTSGVTQTFFAWTAITV